jgi:hypothetical protein
METAVREIHSQFSMLLERIEWSADRAGCAQGHSALVPLAFPSPP